MPNFKLSLLSVTSVALLSMSPALAASIDTTGSDTGTIFNFGYSDTATYGQTFTAGGSSLSSFSLYLRDRYTGSGTLNVRGYIGAWNGSYASSVLFESATQTMNASGTLQEFNFMPNISLTNGSQYVAFLSISNLGVQDVNQFGMPHGGDSIPGAFVFLNNGLDSSAWTSTPWSQGYAGDSDVFFKASFGVSAVPLPGSAPMLGVALIALGALGYGLKRKNETATA